jgi:hypothetical protein
MINRKYWLIAWITISIIQLAFIIYATYSPLYFPILNAPYTQIHSILFGIFATLLHFQSKNILLQRAINITWAIIILLLALLTSFFLIASNIYIPCFIWVVAGFNILLL